MLKNLKWVFLIFALGVAGGIWFSRWSTNKQIAQLKQHGDSAAAHARAVDSIATATHDSLLKARTKLDQIEHAAEAGVASAEHRVEIFHDALHKLADTNTVLLAAIDSSERAHADKEAELQRGKDAADAKVLILGVENASLLRQVHDLSGQVQSLNAEIQKVNSHSMPQWARTGFAILRAGLAVKGGVDLVRGR